MNISENHSYSTSLSPAGALTADDLAAFARLGITPELLSNAGVRRVSDAEARRDNGISFGATKDLSGILFPYFSPVTSHRTTARPQHQNQSH